MGSLQSFGFAPPRANARVHFGLRKSSVQKVSYSPFGEGSELASRREQQNESTIWTWDWLTGIGIHFTDAAFAHASERKR